MNGFLRFLNSKDSPVWWGVFCAAFAVCISYCVSVHLQNAGRVDDYRVKQIEIMMDNMVQFQTFASAFATEMDEKGFVSPDTRSKLIQNLNDQFGRTRAIQQTVPEIDSAILETYRQALSQMITAINEVQTKSSMKNFWSAASHLIVARNQLSQKLRTAI